MKTRLIDCRGHLAVGGWMVVVVLWSMAAPPEVRGVPVTFRFEGEVTEVDDSQGTVGDAISVGSPVSGSFVFESTVPDEDPDPQQALYRNVMTSWNMQMGSAQFSLANFSSIYVEDGPASDKYEVVARLVAPFGDDRWNSFWRFDDPSGQLVDSTALPLTPPDVVPLQTDMSVQFLEAPTAVRVHLDTFTFASISQPGDLDLDGDVDFDDIGDFVLGINDAPGYEAAHGVPPSGSGDTDGDGDFDFDDIPGFVELLGGEGPAGAAAAAVPEPTAALLALLAACAVGWRRQRP